MPERAQPCIVVDEDRIPLQLGHYNDTPRAGVLVSGNEVTVFQNRRQARRAIERTRRYAERDQLPWGAERFRVWNVAEAL